MAETFTISREIGIDMGHRVTYHGSKCRNLHGHRYRIIATCEGPLYVAGEQQGMVLDFGFLKEEMMDTIDALHDHGTTLWCEDPLLETFIPDDHIRTTAVLNARGGVAYQPGNTIEGTKLLVVNFVPTVEHLAKFWFELLAPRVAARSDGQARLLRIEAWETPNCSAVYEAQS